MGTVALTQEIEKNCANVYDCDHDTVYPVPSKQQHYILNKTNS